MASASRGLDDLPHEIAKMILTLLSLADISSLRMTSRSSNSGAILEHFKSHLRCKNVDLTRQGLHAFAQAMTSPLLANCLHELTLIGVVYNTMHLQNIVSHTPSTHHGETARAQKDLDILQQRQQDQDDLSASGEDIHLLSTAFLRLAAEHKLQRLYLSACVYRTDAVQRLSTPGSYDSWMQLWNVAGNAFQITLRSIAKSGLAFNAFRIFWDDQGCSLACEELQKVEWENPALVQSFANLRSLSLSFSDRRIEKSTGDASAQLVDEKNFAGLARLLKNCALLEELRLHHYRLRAPNLEAEVIAQRARHLQQVTDTVKLRRLRKLKLRGLNTREEDLSSLLTSELLEEVHLELMSLTEGTFQSIFEDLCKESRTMKRLYLQSLSVGRGGINFTERVEGPMRGTYVSTLLRTGSEIAKPIFFHVHYSRGRAKGSSALQARMREHQNQYGPP